MQKGFDNLNLDDCNSVYKILGEAICIIQYLDRENGGKGKGEVRTERDESKFPLIRHRLSLIWYD